MDLRGWWTMSGVVCTDCGKRDDCAECSYCAGTVIGVSQRATRVRDFHRKTGQPIREIPTIPTDDEVRFRLRLIAEEFFETIAACVDVEYDEVLECGRDDLESVILSCPIRVDLPGLADGLEDLDYVIEGTRAVFGIDGEPIAREVHRKNMEKNPTPGGKATKPEGWTPPDVRAILIAQGWTPPPKKP